MQTLMFEVLSKPWHDTLPAIKSQIGFSVWESLMNKEDDIASITVPMKEIILNECLA